MKKKWLILSSMLLGCCALSYLLFSKYSKKNQMQRSHLCIQGSYFQPIKITKFISHIPCVDIRIEEKITTAEVDLGFDGNMSLPGAFIENLIDKSFVQHFSYFGMRGKKYESAVYELSKIKIGELVLREGYVQENNPEFDRDGILLRDEKLSYDDTLGRIGWRLFHNLNFFLDCDHSLIAFCDSLDTLKKKGYPTDAFIEVPFHLDRGFIEFEATTPSGPIRCMLDTGCTWNMLNKDLEAGCNDHMIYNRKTIDQHGILNPTNSDQMIFNPEDVYDMPRFKIGKQDFGTVSFQKVKIPFDIEAVIGMDFLDSMLVFIDFPNRKIYFYEQPYTDSG